MPNRFYRSGKGRGRIACVLCLLSFIGYGLVTPVVHAQVLSQQKEAEIDKYIVQEMAARKIPGLALGIYHKGKIIKASAYGLADVQNQGPVLVETVFELASLTKQFTAASILILAQQGKLSIHDPINKYLKDAPENWKPVRIKHLMSHTSGLPVIGKGFSGYNDLSIAQLRQLTSLNITADVAYAEAKKDTLGFVPGEKYVYSDVGYFLLGLIIENASGISYREFLQKNIFDPAGMDHTYLVDQRTVHPFEARGYSLRNGELVNIRRVRDYEVPSHYGIFSTISDLAKWDSLLYTNQILTDESKALMWTPMVLNNGVKYPYGFGWNTWTNNGKRIVDHTGITGTQITRVLSDSLTVVVLTNLGTGAGGVAESWGIAPRVAEKLGSTPFIQENHTVEGTEKVTKVNLKKLQALTGTYRMKDGTLTRNIELKNGELFYTVENRKNRLLPLKNGTFLMLDTLDEWVLVVDETKNDKPITIRWTRNKLPNVVMERVDDNPDAR